MQREKREVDPEIRTTGSNGKKTDSDLQVTKPRRSTRPGHAQKFQQQRRAGGVVEPSSASSTVDREPDIAWIRESFNNLAEAHCEEVNRPVQTRTSGGV